MSARVMVKDVSLLKRTGDVNSIFFAIDPPIQLLKNEKFININYVVKSLNSRVVMWRCWLGRRERSCLGR